MVLVQKNANEYSETKLEYFGVNRFLNSSAFTCVLPNTEVVTHDWLVYSPSNTVYFVFHTYCSHQLEVKNYVHQAIMTGKI